MQEFYFFRNVKDYDELMDKTARAIQKNSINKSKASVVKTIKLNEEDFEELINNFSCNRKYIYDNIVNMKIQNGIWKCIEITDGKLEIIVMSDGYQYPRFIAIK